MNTQRPSSLLAALLLVPALGFSQSLYNQGFTADLNTVRGAVRDSIRKSPLGVRFTLQVQDPIKGPEGEKIGKEAQAVFKMASPAVVTVKTRTGQGSGFIVDPEGIVVTNGHVVGAEKKAMLEFPDGRKFSAAVLAVAPGRDIALLRIESKIKDWPALPLGQTETMLEGSLVYALGNPTGLGMSFSRGMVSQRRQMKLSPYTDFILSDISISQGNSGGPLLDHSGRVVGINTAIVGTLGRIGVAVTVETLQDAVKEFQATGKLADGYAGFALHPASGHENESPIPVIHQIDANALAAKAGLKIGDAIVSVGGKPVSSKEFSDNAFAVMRSFARSKPGEKISIEIQRPVKVSLRVVGGPEDQAVDAYMVSDDVVLHAPGIRGFLMVVAAYGKPAEMVHEGKAYPIKVEEVDQNGAFAIFRLDGNAGLKLPKANPEKLEVAVQEFPVEAEAQPAGR